MPDDSELSQRRLSGLSKIAGLVGVVATGVGLGPAAAGAGLTALVINETQERIKKRQQKRLERIMSSLANRLDSVEKTLSDEPPLDLFTEYLRKAVNDENEEKAELHAAFLDWVLTREPKPAIARLLGDAICTLSPHELAAFVLWVRTQRGPKDALPVWISESMFWNRVEAAGLFGGGGVKSTSNLTRLGSDLEAICPTSLGDLDCGPPTGQDPSHER